MSALADEIKAALREVVHEELPALLRAHFPQMEPTAVPEVPGSLSVTETAKLAHRHPDTIRRAIRGGVLHATRPAGAREWIIDRAEVERWIRGSHSPDPTSMQAEVEKAVARVLDR